MKVKKLLCTLLITLSTVLGLAFSAACAKNPVKPPVDPPKEEGPETGVYYYDSDEGEYLISLGKGDQVVFTTAKLSAIGTYSIEGGNLTFTVPAAETDGEDEKGTNIPAILAGNVLTVTYEETEWRFLKKIMYSVVFDTGIQEEATSVSVLNGKTIAKPADPTREGQLFLGWYADKNYQKLYNFGSETVTKDTTLYAQWTPVVPEQTEYEIKFDLNYEGAESVESIQTIGGKLYNVTTPERDGYDFGGWWISVYNDPDRLSYKYTEDMVFSENLTMYAKWLPKSTGNKLSAPVVTVTETGITWTDTGAATYWVELAYIRENGDEQLLIGQFVTSPGQKFDFSSAAAGDYVVRVKSCAAISQNDSDPAIVYYLNKGLEKVSDFSVAGDALIFNAVPHAEKYLVTVDCGNKEHNHTLFDNGKSTYYNFSNCEMQEGGIKFTVTAVADGYASSTSETFVYERTLESISQFAFDNENETLSWKAVPAAASYIVTITYGGKSVTMNIGGKTQISLKQYASADGDIKVGVYPKTKGYNSPEAAEYTYKKTALATPSDIKISGTILSWASVDGAEKYEIRIGQNKYLTNTKEAKFDLSSIDNDMNWTKAADYRLSIRAIGAQNSSWSDEIDIRYYALYSTLSYAEGLLSWRHVVGAAAYEVKVNDGEVQTLTDGSNHTAITFNRAGENILSIRFFDGNVWSDWATLTVKAYEISFDSRGGSGVDSFYKAIGDPVDFPESTRAGYTFGGWYNSVSGASGNGALYRDEFFGETGDIMLYAYWKPATFKVTYDCGEGNTIENESGEVMYGKAYQLDVPTPADGTLVFMGWYSEANGKGIQYTDAAGKSLDVWKLPYGVPVIACWQQLLSYSRTSDGNSEGYSVVRNKKIAAALYVDITIPATYQGPDDSQPLPVLIVDGAAFASCSSLESIRIPNCVTIIESTAFNNCSSLKKVEIYNVDGVIDPVYSSLNGTIIFKNPRTKAVDLFYVPQGLAGDENGTYFVPDDVTNIPYRAFNGNVFVEIVVSKSVVTIEGSAFYNCSNLAKVTFAPGGTDTLIFRGDTFRSCSALTEVTIPARVSEFDPSFFASCSSLQRINVEESEKSLYASEDGMLFNKNKSELLYCPAGRTGKYEFASSVAFVGEKAFYKCKNIQELVFNGWMQYIGESAFEGCSTLVKITFKGAENNEAVSLAIGKSAFQDCKELTDIVFEAKSRVTEIGELAFKNCSKLVAISLPASLETIGARAFETTKISSLTFAKDGKLAAIGDSAFLGLPIASLQFPASLAKIGAKAFGNNSYLTSVEFADSTTELTIGTYAFQSCSTLKTITIPKNVVSIEDGVFDRCTKLASITVDPESEYYLTADGVLFDKNFTQLLFYPAGKTGTFVLPKDVKSIGAGVFRGNESLTSIQIGNQVTSIGTDAFRECSNLKEVIFDLDTTNTETLVFGNSVFYDCRALTSLELPNRVEKIPDEFVKSCFSLGSFIIPDSVTEIGTKAFTSTALKNITIPASVTLIGNSAFSKDTSTKGYNPPPLSVVFENGEEPLEVGIYLFDQSVVESVTLPERLINISDYMFYRCYSLKQIEIPSTVISIGYAAFNDCTNLVRAYFKDSEDPNRTVTVADGEYKSGGSTGDSDYYYGAFCNNTSLKEVTLPKGLTRVANYMFYGCAALERIVIPNTITNGAEDAFAVGQCAFKNCTNLRVVDFQTGGTGQITIGGSSYYRYSATGTSFRASVGAFQGCVKLETVNFPENLAGTTDVKGKEIAAVSATGQIFDGCTSLTSFHVAKGSAVDNYYYSTENGLLCYKSGDENILLMCAPGATGKIVVPNTITKISHMEEDLYKTGAVRVGFNNCNYVTEIEFEKGGEHDLTIDGSFYIDINHSGYYGAFSDMEMLQRVTLPARLKTLGGCAFANCPNLTQVDFEKENSRLESIEEYAFYNTDFTTITLPDSVKTLGNYLFANASLQSITLPGSLEALGATFANCSTLQELVFTSGGNMNFTSVNGIVYKLVKNASGETIGRELAYYPYGKTDTSFQVPADVVKIGDSAFKDNRYLQTLTFENSLEALKADRSNALVLGEAAFQNCTGLTSVVLPVRLTTSYRLAFAGCAKLKTVTFEDACELQTISEGMFWSCGNLRSITIPKKVTFIDNGAFVNSPFLKTVTFAADGSPVQLYANASSTSYTYVPNDSSGSYKLGVFAGCFGLETVNFNNRLSETTIPAYTFNQCRSLSKLNDVKIEDVAKYAFYNCTSFADDTLDFSKLTSEIINTNAFYGCESLKNVSLPESVKTIDSNAFYGCISLQNINLEKVEYIAASAFKNCSDLIEADLSGFLGYSEKYPTVLGSSTFEGCASLTHVILPATLTKISGSAFKGCEALVSIALPEALATLDTSAFEGCASLSAINLDKVQYINQKAFLDCTALTFVDLSGFIGYGTSSSNIGKLYTDTFRNTGLTSFTFNKSDATKTNVIPATIKQLSNGVFAGTKLKSLAFEDSDVSLYLSSGSSPTSTLSHSYGVFEGCTELASVDFGERKLSISTCTFRDCAIEEIVIGKAVTLINSNAFYGCTKLRKVSIPTDGALTTIGVNVFTDMTTLATVEFTSSGTPGTKFTTIDDNAFQNTGISEIVIPTSVTNIGAYAFEGCRKLTSVTFAGDVENPSKLSWIGDGYTGNNKYASYTFANCPLLKTVVFPVGDNVKIGDSTFTNSGIEEITLSDSVTAIGYGAFKDCGKLKTVNIDASNSQLSIMQPYAFADCGFEEMPTIPAKLTYINSYVFSGCAQMTNALIPSNVETIFENAFENCTRLSTVEFKEGVTGISDYAFLNCTSLETIGLPASLETIDKNPFVGCANLQSIDVSTNANFTFQDDAFYSETTLVMVMPNKQGTFFVPNSVTAIAPGAFAGTKISSIIINNPDMMIGSYAFAYMKQLESITLPANLTEIPEGAFAYSGLTNMEIPAAITAIGEYAFAYSALTGMDIPETVTSIGGYAFYGCAELETLTFGAENYEFFGDYIFAHSGVSSLVLPGNVTKIHDGMFEGCVNLTNVTFTNAVTSIGAYAFKNCGLTEFVIPNTVTSLAGGAFSGSALENIVFEEGGETLVLGDWNTAKEEQSAFAGLESLTSVTLARISVIPAYLFANCTNLTTINLPASVETIGKYAFMNTGAIKTAGAESFVIPATVTKINFGAFLGSNIEAVVFAEGDTPITLTNGSESSGKVSKEGIFQETKSLKSVTWSSRVTSIPSIMFYSSGIEVIDLPEGLTKIGNYAFYNSGIRTAVIPNSVTGTNGGTYMFSECKNLETVTLSEKMTVVPIGAFMNSNLQRIVIPANITDLYSYSFSGCSNLTSVTFIGESIKLAKQTFMDCTALNELVLPSGTVATAVEVFSGWTQSQTIKIPQEGEGISWTLGWDTGCKAKIIWQA